MLKASSHCNPSLTVKASLLHSNPQNPKPQTQNPNSTLALNPQREQTHDTTLEGISLSPFQGPEMGSSEEADVRKSNDSIIHDKTRFQS